MEWSPGYGTTHSPRGLFTACLPLGLAGFVVFQSVMKRPLFALLPDAVRRRSLGVADARVTPSLRVLLAGSVAVVIGATTHLAWDSFTHQGRVGTRLVPGLNATALIVSGRAVPGYKVFQYGSTLVGLPLLAAWLGVRLGRRDAVTTAVRPALSGRTRVVIGLVAAAIPLVATLSVVGRGGLSPYQKLGRSITLSGSALGLATLGYSAAFTAIEGRNSRRRAV